MSVTKKVLYVDDEPINVLIFERIISKKFEVVTAGNGQEALDVLERHPDISEVVSDMRMPGMSGLELIRKAKEKYPNKGYYILTGYNINEELQRALDTGLILRCWTKPANFDEISNALASR